ncbi:MAG: hypothetical protein RRZ65_10815 [Tannerellaceae bacterium]
MKVHTKIGCFVLLLSLVSCIKENLGICPGSLDVVYDWTQTTPLADTDSLMIIGKDGKSHIISTSKEGAPLDLPSGEYRLVAYEGNPYVNIENDVLTAQTTNEGQLGQLTPFRAGTNTLTLAPSDQTLNKKVEITMWQQTRLFVVKVHFQGAGLKFLQGVSGQLDGIAIARLIEHGFPPADAKPRHAAIKTGLADLVFEKQTTPPAKSMNNAVVEQQDFSAEKRLLGLDGNTDQKLKLTLNLDNTTQELEINLMDKSKSKALSDQNKYNVLGFHVDDVLNPFLIEITIRLGQDFTADIVDWTAGPDSELDAH